MIGQKRIVASEAPAHVVGQSPPVVPMSKRRGLSAGVKPVQLDGAMASESYDIQAAANWDAKKNDVVGQADFMLILNALRGHMQNSTSKLDRVETSQSTITDSMQAIEIKQR